MIGIAEVRSKQQIEAVARLAREIWSKHYVPIIGQPQVDYMLARFQSELAIARQIAAGVDYVLVLRKGKPVGYMAVAPTISEDAGMLSKLYVRQSLRGLGLGKTLLGFAEAICRRFGCERIWLTVNKQNTSSIAWYEHMGFAITCAVVQDIGNGFVMDDYRMEKPLDSGAEAVTETGRDGERVG